MSDAAVGSLYKGFNGTTGIVKVLVQVPTSDYFAATGATEATLSIKCDVRKANGDVVKQIYRNTFTDSDTVRTIDWGPNRPCERIRSVFIRAIPGNGITVQQAVDTLSNPSFPDNRPLRITIGSFS